MTRLPAQIAYVAIASGVALAAAALSILAVWRAQALARGAARKGCEAAPQVDASIGVLQQKVEELQQQVDDLRRQPSPPPPAARPRAGLNLDKRSQALRMHRRGEQPGDIAAALDIPLQEVNLLLKVHRIVLRSI